MGAVKRKSEEECKQDDKVWGEHQEYYVTVESFPSHFCINVLYHWYELRRISTRQFCNDRLKTLQRYMHRKNQNCQEDCQALEGKLKPVQLFVERLTIALKSSFMIPFPTVHVSS